MYLRKPSPQANASAPIASIASSCTVVLCDAKTRRKSCTMLSANCMSGADAVGEPPSLEMMTVSVPQSSPCSSLSFSRPSSVLTCTSNVWLSLPMTTGITCSTTFSVSLALHLMDSLSVSYASCLSRPPEAPTASARSLTASSVCTVDWKKGDRGEVASSECSRYPAARLWMAQHTLVATWGTSLPRLSSSTPRMDGSSWAVSTGGSTPGPCRNSKMRPSVHAVESFTWLFGSFIARSMNGMACCTSGASVATLGPSRTDPNANVAASRLRQSWLLTFSCTKGMTSGTTSSSATLATRDRHVPPAVATFHTSSSSAASSSCLVSVSSSMGVRNFSAFLMNPWFTTPSSW
mmetsp:Transcript_8298/g.29143  ORF Transcript_8298/g.29143 Transcript_8298/m.29143 type:complete len:349 (+) Transcript_8298:727-1773(+)